MLHHRKAEPPRRAPSATALDAGATIQDALVRRLRLARRRQPRRRRRARVRGSRADHGGRRAQAVVTPGPPVVCVRPEWRESRSTSPSTVGNTPMVQLTRLVPEGLDVELYGKLEAFNPGGSVKDRIGVAMLDAAERDGLHRAGPHDDRRGDLRQHRHRARLLLRGQGLRAVDLPAPGHEPRARGAAAPLRRAGRDRRVARRHGRGGRRRPRRGPRRRRLPARPVLQPRQPRGPPHGHRPRDPRRRSTARSTSSSPGVGTGGTITGVGEALKAHNPQGDRHRASSPRPRRCSRGGGPGPAPHPGHRRRLRPRRAGPRGHRRGHGLLATTTRSPPPTLAAAREGILAGISCGAALWARARGRPAPGVARQAHRHRPARLGRALHLGAVLRAARAIRPAPAGPVARARGAARPGTRPPSPATGRSRPRR